ncbi:hypothetical protein F5880DRAFT_890723 [Lentinula raphanica]|nr:hypothetical protein F5880DRAFT_890723 [Lentinula raphanica]
MPRYKKAIGKTSKGEKLWLVNKVLDDRFNNDSGRVEYLVQWEGWPTSYNSWEPAEYLERCRIPLEKYFKREQHNALAGKIKSSDHSPSSKVSCSHETSRQIARNADDTIIDSLKT